MHLIILNCVSDQFVLLPLLPFMLCFNSCFYNSANAINYIILCNQLLYLQDNQIQV